MTKQLSDSQADRMKKTRQITDDDKFRMCLAIDYSWTMLEANRKGLNPCGQLAVDSCARDSLENQESRSVAYSMMLDLYGDPSKKPPESRFLAELLFEGSRQYLKEQES